MSVPPKFIETDVDVIKNSVIADYEEFTKKTLQPGQAERLFCNYIAYRESLVRVGIQQAALLYLIRYSKPPILNEIGKMFDCHQLEAKPSQTLFECSVKELREYDVLVEKGTQIESKDQKFIFVTNEDVILRAGESVITVKGECQTPTDESNGYKPGDISNIIPLVDVDEIKNITETTGGAALESEESYKERLQQALNKASTAGAKAGYIYHTKSAHQDIIDVNAANPQTQPSFKIGNTVYSFNDSESLSIDNIEASVDLRKGEMHFTFAEPVMELVVSIPPAATVEIYPLTKDGKLSDEIKELVESSLNDEKIRPLTDYVTVVEPTEIVFKIKALVKVYKDADLSKVQTQVEQKLDEYIAKMKATLSNNIVPSQIISIFLSVDGVYDVELETPQYKVLKINEWASGSYDLRFERAV